MTAQEMIGAARRLVDAFNDGDWDRTSALLTTDSLYHEVGTQRRLHGSDEIIPSLKGWKDAMPDVKGTVTNALATNGTAVLEVTWDGTHTGPLAGPAGTIPASGKRQSTASAWIFEFEGDKIKESRNYFDMLAMLQQIGAVPH
jgi:steroid delta-isomerase-like uncharacterized protein